MTERDEIIEMARQIATQASKVGPCRTWTHEHAMSLIMQLVDASAAKEREVCFSAAMAASEKAIDAAMKLEREALLQIVYGYAANLAWNEDFQADIKARGES